MSDPWRPPGTYRVFPLLKKHLPQLVQRQRRLAAKIAKVAKHVVDEKETRRDICLLLAECRFTKSQMCTVGGYDVRYMERDGVTSVDSDRLIEQLVAAGVDRDLVVQTVNDATTTGDPAKFATVNPTKGAKVR